MFYHSLTMIRVRGEQIDGRSYFTFLCLDEQSQYNPSSSSNDYDYDGGGNGGDYLTMLMKAVPGTPGQDYPLLSSIPATSFSCQGRVFGGYYADPQAQCQVNIFMIHDTNKWLDLIVAIYKMLNNLGVPCVWETGREVLVSLSKWNHI